MGWIGNVAARVAERSESARPRGARELERRLAKLERFFDADRVMAGSLGAAEVARYYEQCIDAYLRYHSTEGAVHMALNEGEHFDADGYAGQPRLLEAAWRARPQPPGDVLELAFGQGYNLLHLAAAFAGTRFEGIDLTPVQVQMAGERIVAAGLRNVTLRQGDFHALPQADASFDDVFCVEAFCYAYDTPRALAEVARVLRPGGRFTLFDGYLPRPAAQMTSEEARAVALVARGMALDAFQEWGAFTRAAQAAGFDIEHQRVLDRQVLPSLARLERLTGAIIAWPWLGRRALRKRPPARSGNVLSGYLMRSCIERGVLVYQHLVLRKKGLS